MNYLQQLMDPTTQGLLSAGSALLQAGGPSPTPVSFGQGLGQAGNAFLGGMRGGMQMQQQQALVDLEKIKAGQGALQMNILLNQENLKREALGLPPLTLPAMPNLGGSGPALASGSMPALSAPAMANMPTAPDSAPTANMPTAPAQAPTAPMPGGLLGGLPGPLQNPARLDLIFNSGKGLPALATPNITYQSGVPVDTRTGQMPTGAMVIPQIHNGVALDMSKVQPGAVPQVLTSQDGKSVSISVGPNGPTVAPLPGAMAAYTGFMDASEASKAKQEKDVIRIGTTDIETTRAIANALRTGIAVDAETQNAAAQLASRHNARVAIRIQGQPAFQNEVLPSSANPQGPSVGEAQRVGVVPDKADEAGRRAAADKIGQGLGEQYAQLMRDDFNANATLNQFSRMRDLYSQVSTGRFKGTTAQLKAAAKGVGIDLEALGIKDDVAPVQAVTALSRQLSLDLRNPAGGAGMPGALSDKDRDFLTSMVPSVENDPGAIGKMLDWRMALAKRSQQVAKQAREYKKSHGGNFDEGFFDELATWSEKHPIFDHAGPAVSPRLQELLNKFAPVNK